jgi:hypothetical protein
MLVIILIKWIGNYFRTSLNLEETDREAWE